MDRAGGYLDLLALEGNARRYDDLRLAMAGEADAAQVRALQARQAADRAKRRVQPVKG
jgi:hypothetical protein